MNDLLPGDIHRKMMLVDVKREHRLIVKEMQILDRMSKIPRRCTDRRFSPDITAREIEYVRSTEHSNTTKGY